MMASHLALPQGVLGVRGDVRIGGHYIDGQIGPNLVAYNFSPNNSDMVIDTSNTVFFGPQSDAIRLRNTASHEAGHGLGLWHVCPADATKLMEPGITLGFDGPQHDDIQGIQRLYGDFYEDNNFSEVATDLGSLDQDDVSLSDVSINNAVDSDYYAFHIAQHSKLDLTLHPVGSSYIVGPQTGACNTGTPFNSHLTANLGVQVVSADGVSVIAEANSKGKGIDEALSDVPLAGPASYFVHVFTDDLGNNLQLYDIDITTTFSSVVTTSSISGFVFPRFGWRWGTGDRIWGKWD